MPPYIKSIILLIINITLVIAVSNRTASRYVLKNILNIKVEESTSIFFLDTTRVSYIFKRLQIEHRTACSIESAATIHPNRTVYLLYTTPGYIDLRDDKERHFQVLLSHDNVRMAYVNITQLAKNTPVEELLRENLIEKSEYSINHYSDLLRILVLWKFGGIYLDNDVLVLKSFDGLRRNFVGLEDDTMVGNCVLGFRGKIFRDRFVGGILLNEFKKNYDHKSWAGTGPKLMSRFVRQLYDTDDLPSAVDRLCRGLRIYSPEHFCPINYPSWHHYFDTRRTESVLKKTRNSYALHFWNKMSHAKIVKATMDVAYVWYTEKYCPEIMTLASRWF